MSGSKHLLTGILNSIKSEAKTKFEMKNIKIKLQALMLIVAFFGNYSQSFSQDITDDQLLDFMQMQQNRSSFIDESNQGVANQDSNTREYNQDSDDETKENEPIILEDFELDSRPVSRNKEYQLKRFGSEIFESERSNFNLSQNPIVSDNYIVGPGDVVKIIIFGTKNPRYNLRVTREGEIYIPQIGPIEIAGLTFEDMKKYVSQKIQENIIGVRTSITLGELRSINVFVVGGSENPGNYIVKSMTTLMGALFVSGGISDSGSMRSIELRRQGQLITSVDLYDLFLNGDTSNDQQLRDGDVVLITNINKTVGIAGEVRRPGLFELKDGENINDLIKFAGGIKPTADKYDAQIQRINDQRSFTMIDINPYSENIKKTLLLDGDILRIYPISKSFDNVILTRGLIRERGFYQWFKGIKISDIVKSFQDLLPETDRNYVLIKRENMETGSLEFLQADLIEVIKNNSSKYNHLLESRDEIFFFNSLPVQEGLIEENMDENNFTELSFQARNKDQNQEDNEEVQIIPIEDMIDPEKEAIVIRENYIEKVSISDLQFYLDQGFEEAIIDENLSDELERKNDEYIGDRISIIEPMIEMIENQFSNSISPPVITISGSVLFPGDYPLTKGMNLRDAVNASGGFNDNTYTDEIELLRSIKSQQGFAYQRFVYSEKDIDRILLKPSDSINLKALEQVKRTVIISGEVNFPGAYAIGDNERISDLVNRAGGYKDSAFKDGAVFQRESIKEAESARLKKLSNTLRQQLLVTSAQNQSSISGNNQDLSSETIDAIISTISSTEATGRLVIDLDKIETGTQLSPILEDGDSLYIPRTPQSVSVIGEVRVPSSHLYRGGITLNDYIERSGGVSEYANEDDIYVISANGSIVDYSGNGFFRSGELSPGDTIVVPLKAASNQGLKAANEISQVIYQIAVATAAISGIRN